MKHQKNKSISNFSNLSSNNININEEEKKKNIKKRKKFDNLFLEDLSSNNSNNIYLLSNTRPLTEKTDLGFLSNKSNDYNYNNINKNISNAGTFETKIF